MPPWHPVFGHLLILPEILEQLPNGSQQGYMFSILARDFPESDSLFYIDLWPFSGPILIVCTPGYAYQANQEYDFPKPDSLLPFFRPITGGLGMFMMNGEEHKASRALFNPGFADSVIFQNASVIVEQAEIYVGLLREHAKKGDMFSLDEMTCSYMMDVIGVVTL
jgi:cytochrome P450